MASKPPAEIAFEEKWDRLVDVSLRRVVYGTLAGSLAALVLFRGPSTRAAAIAFGAGCGAGSAWTTCSKDVSFHRLQHGLFTRTVFLGGVNAERCNTWVHGLPACPPSCLLALCILSLMLECLFWCANTHTHAHTTPSP